MESRTLDTGIVGAEITGLTATIAAVEYKEHSI